MKVTFLQKDSFVKLAIAQLSAVLKKNGHACDVIIESGEKKFLGSVLESRADLFAFSCTTGEEQWVQDIALKIRKHSSIPIIMGGPHATFSPRSIEDPNIDYICRGEGEDALLELLDALSDNPVKIRDIQNIWSKDSAGKVVKTEVRPFLQDLDRLPFADLAVYHKYKYMIPYNRDMYPVMTGRGCPYNCSYCFNRSYKEIYRGKGKYLRKRSPQHVVRELIHAKKTLGIKKINFVDDSFLLFPEWLREFSVLYRENVGLPCIVNVEATQVTEELVRLLKTMGCICVRMGVETGNEELRRNVLHKNITNRQIRETAKFIKENKIKLSTYNILGLPGETLENALETYMFNKEIRADFASCSLLQPYPGTAMNEYVKAHGYLPDENDEPALGPSFFSGSNLAMENQRAILNLQKLMQVFILFHVPASVVRRIIQLPENPLFGLIFRVGFVYNKMRTQKIRIGPLFRLALHSRSYMK